MSRPERREPLHDPVILARTREELERGLRALRSGGRSLALVPTMGALHEGHLSLVDRAREEADEVAVSIFVNPLQFGPDEDLDRYPRDLEGDVARAGDRGGGLVFAPSIREMYPEGEPRITVDPGPLADRLCGRYRPGHFRGVLTVVAKLLGLFRPEVAVFGRKDFQQSVLIRRMVTDLELETRIAVGPVNREEDGLARSSRNRLLSPEERADAVGLFRGLSAALDLFAAGERRAEVLQEAIREEIRARERLELQYVEVVEPEELEPVDPVPQGAVAAVAAFCGGTRLIDNVVLRKDENG